VPRITPATVPAEVNVGDADRLVLPPSGVGRERVGEHLDRHVAIEGGVHRPPHDSHAALADLLVEAVVGEHLARFEWHADLSP